MAATKPEASPQERCHATLMRELRQNVPVSLSLNQMMHAAHHQATTEDRPEWQSGIFTVARIMKSAPSLAAASGAQALREVEKVLAKWDDKGGKSGARAARSWSRWFGVPAEDARAEFLSGWGKVRCVPGRGPWDHAWAQAARQPIQFRDESLCLDSPAYAKFVTFAGWLQVANGAKAIMLPVRKLAPLLQVEPMTVSRYRQFAVADSFLREVAAVNLKARKATEFIFDVRRVPIFRDAAHADLFAWTDAAFRQDG